MEKVDEDFEERLRQNRIQMRLNISYSFNFLILGIFGLIYPVALVIAPGEGNNFSVQLMEWLLAINVTLTFLAIFFKSLRVYAMFVLWFSVVGFFTFQFI